MHTHRLTGPIEQARGVIGRYPGPDEEYVFEFDTVTERELHMLFVRRPLRARFYVGDDLVLDTVMRAWTGTASAECDRIVESRPG